MYMDLSGVFIDDEDGSLPRQAIFSEGQKQIVTAEIDQDTLRSVEILRHLPVAVSRFNCDGDLIGQNPQAQKLFGSTCLDAKKDNCDTNTSLLDRFVDRDLGRNIIEAVLEEGVDKHVEAQQHMPHGPRWFAIDIRRSLDPIDANDNIIYTAQDITDVIHAKKEADSANNAKTELFAILAHEIRTPLHQVHGFLELLGHTELTPQQAEYVKLMESSSATMMCVISDLLDFTKLEDGNFEIESIPFDPSEVASSALGVVLPKAAAKGLVLQNNLDAVQLPKFLCGDPNRLRQLLINFLTNSVKFTHKGKILLDVSIVKGDGSQQPKTNDDQVVLEFAVSDTGIGISSEHQKIIFKEYQQVDRSASRKYAGSGIGLAICQKLVEKMDGTIGVSSEIGRGSTFWSRIPFSVDSRSHNTHIYATIHDDFPSDVRDLSILVVEDNVINQKLAKDMLKRLGHKVTLAADGLKAVEAAEKSVFDLILMDSKSQY